MNVRAPLERVYDSRMWWVMLAGCAARFSAERSGVAALSGFTVWAAIFGACWILRARYPTASQHAARVRFTANAVAGLGGLVFLLQLIGAGLVPALLVFLFAIQAALFLIASTRLHAWLLLAAALVGVLFAAAESRSSLFLICAVWFTFAALGLLELDHRRDRERVMSLQPVMSGKQRTGGVVFALLALLCAMPLYLFTPKPTGLMLGGMQATAAYDAPAPGDSTKEARSEQRSQDPQRSDDQPAPQSSGSEPSAPYPPDPREDPAPARPQSGSYGDSFDVDEVHRETALSNAIVLYVKSSRPLNLRGLVFDRFENHRWYRDAQPFVDLELERGNLAITALPLGADAVEQTIEVVRDLDATLVHAPGVRRLRFPAPGIRRYVDDVFVAPQPLRARTTYSIESRLDVTVGRYSLAHRTQHDFSRYLNASAASERMRKLARETTAAYDDARSKALALEALLRTEYQYSYETIEQQGYTPLDWFLFEGRRGHCEYFASALAVLLRTLDIPSRLVTGFSLPAPNPVTGYHEVRALDGHAWVEAFIDGRWLMLEPTPFYPLPRPEEGAPIADQLDDYLERMAQTNALLDPHSLKTRVALVMREAWRQVRNAMSAIARVPRALGWILPIAIVLGALASFVTYLAIMAVADWRENRELRGLLGRATRIDAREATLLTAQALLVASAARGLERHAGASLREHLATLEAAGIAVPAAFVDGFDAARYGGDPREIVVSATQQAGQVLLGHIAADPWPRVRRTIASWRSWLAPRTL